MLEKVVKAVKKIVVAGVVAGVVLGLPGGILYSFNQSLHNHESVDSTGGYASHADGFFGHTRLIRLHIRDLKMDELYRFSMFGPSTVINDGGHWGQYDGLVDRIHFMSDKKDFVLYRKTDYPTHKAEFDEAEADLKAAQERFAEQFKPMH